MFIAIVGMALAGVLVVYNQAVRGSADPLVRKQALAVAESLLNEVLAAALHLLRPAGRRQRRRRRRRPATARAPAARQARRTRAAARSGPQPAGETRFSATDPFDNVADYHGYAMTAGIYGLDDGATPSPALEATPRASRSRAPGGSFGLASDGAVLRIDVQVSGRGETITLTGYRFRHSPNATG